MKANELRIYNYVLAEVGLPSLNIHCILANDIVDISKGFVNVSPIPLTEEWLLKFGFEKGNKYWHNGLGSNIFYDLDNKYLRQAYGTGVNITMFAISAMNIQYVHQLQNLYFALTGEELTVK